MFDLYDFGIWSKAMNLIEIFYVTSKLHGSLLVFTISTANNNTTAQKKTNYHKIIDAFAIAISVYKVFRNIQRVRGF